MAAETYQGIVRDGKIILLNDSPPLTDGTAVIVTPMVLVPGTGAAVLAAAEAAPRVPSEWVDELEQLIAAGRSPPTQFDPFAEESNSEDA